MTKPGTLLSQLLGLSLLPWSPVLYPGVARHSGRALGGYCMHQILSCLMEGEVGRDSPLITVMVITVVAQALGQEFCKYQPIGFSCPISAGGIQSPTLQMRKLRLMKTE